MSTKPKKKPSPRVKELMQKREAINSITDKKNSQLNQVVPSTKAQKAHTTTPTSTIINANAVEKKQRQLMIVFQWARKNQEVASSDFQRAGKKG